MKKRIIIYIFCVVAIGVLLQVNASSSNDLKAFQTNNLESKETYDVSNNTEPRNLTAAARWAVSALGGGALYDAATAKKHVGKGTGRKQGASAGYSACY
ncbi:hypothetical protein AST12_08500 [Staphylococcus succinus]|nr:hypothetical protein AST12_08500 [Staphylococcus succinus]